MRRAFIRPIILSLALISPFILTADFPKAQDDANYSASRLDAWRILGPGGGGAQFHPAVSPHDPNLVLVACDMTGAYISENGGKSWRLFDLRDRVRSFAFDPINPNVIYARTEVLWRSADRGRTWSLVFPPPHSVTGLIMPDDHASSNVLTGWRWGIVSVRALAIDPADSKKLYVSVAEATRSSPQLTGKLSAALYFSDDRGAHWRRVQTLALAAEKIFIDPRSPASDRTLYFVEWNSVNVRKAGVWRQGPPPTPEAQLINNTAGFAYDDQLTVYAIVVEAKDTSKIMLFISRDGGASWKNLNQAFLHSSGANGSKVMFTTVATCASHPEVAYVSYDGLRLGGQDYHGVAKTTDSGATWQLVWKEAKSPAPNVHDSWITERFGTGWGEPGISLGVAPTNPEICYETDDGRTMRTLDGGKTWEAVYSHRLSDGTYTTTGLDVTTNYGVFFDPFDSRRMFIAYTDIGLFRSENGGESWTSSTSGVPKRWVNTTYWIAFDPAVKGRVWGVMSDTHDLPRPKMWRGMSPRRYVGGVCVSDDGGKSWRPSSHGMPPTAATDILLDPASPVNARVLYVTGFGKGVFKSADGGKTWALRDQGLAGLEPFAWRLARDKDGVLYLVVARRSEDGSFGNAQDGALYRSRDGAGHWEKVELPKGVNGPNGLAIDPDDPHRLYLAAWGRNKWDEGAVDGGIFVSTDGGGSWRNVLSQDRHVYDITVDPRDPRTLYACGFESSAWRSTDRGETWNRIKGFNFKWGHRVIPDPLNPDFIYVTTFGGSVWYGPARGDPRAVEDIVTPALAYGRR